MEQDKAIQLTNNNVQLPSIPDAKSLAALRLDKSVPHYKDLPRDKRTAWLKTQIMTLNMIRHQIVEGWQVEFDAQTLDEFLMDDIYARDYTFPEIKDAFKRGLMGDYGDYYGLTAESLYGFIRGYFMSEKKRKATDIVRESLRKSEASKNEEAILRAARLHADEIAKSHKV